MNALQDQVRDPITWLADLPEYFDKSKPDSGLNCYFT